MQLLATFWALDSSPQKLFDSLDKVGMTIHSPLVRRGFFSLGRSKAYYSDVPLSLPNSLAMGSIVSPKP